MKPFPARCLNSFPDGRCVMIRGDQIDVVGAFILQLEHDIRKPFDGNRLAALTAGNLCILAVDAAETAAGKEDGTGPFPAGNAGFFPHVQGRSGSPQLRRAMADTGFPGRAVGPAAARA